MTPPHSERSYCDGSDGGIVADSGLCVACGKSPISPRDHAEHFGYEVPSPHPEKSGGFRFGREGRNGGSCCGKPQGCSMQHDGCLYLQHPWKRQLRGEITIEQRDNILRGKGSR